MSSLYTQADVEWAVNVALIDQLAESGADVRDLVAQYEVDDVARRTAAEILAEAIGDDFSLRICVDTKIVKVKTARACVYGITLTYDDGKVYRTKTVRSLRQASLLAKQWKHTIQITIGETNV